MIMITKHLISELGKRKNGVKRLSKRNAFGGKVICDVLRNLAPFVQFKKREKLPWRSVT